MAYDKTPWSNNATALSAENMNHIEQGIYDAHELIASVASVIYPVGSIYMSTDDTDPGTFFGGTWVPWGSGRVPVGVDAEDTNFNTVEKEGGTADSIVPSHNHTFTGNAMGGHQHGLAGHTHTMTHTHTLSHQHGTGSTTSGRFVTVSSSVSTDSGNALSGSDYNFVRSGGAFASRDLTGGATNSTTSTPSTTNTGGASGNSTSASAGTPSGTISTEGVAAANQNLQPYITCYMFKRVS